MVSKFRKTISALTATALVTLLQVGPASAGTLKLADKYQSHGNITVPVLSIGTSKTTDFTLALNLRGKNVKNGLEPGTFKALLSNGTTCNGEVSVMNLGTIRFKIKAGTCANVALAPTSGDILLCGFDNDSNRVMACTYTRKGLVDRTVVMRKR